MAQRRRIDIFFILYLTAIVGFVVVSRERDKIDTGMLAMNEQIVRTFVPPVPLAPESDTLSCYVDADSNGIVIGEAQVFRTKVFASDIAQDDAISVSLHSVLYNGTLSTPDVVSIGPRTAVGSVHERTVYFPVLCMFPRTGSYVINISAAASRVHETARGVFQYRGITFDTTLVPRAMVNSIERGGTSLTVVVEDTSLDRPNPLQPLRIDVDRAEISSAVGFVEYNRIVVNLGWTAPKLRIIRGLGALEEISRNERAVAYRWSGTVKRIPRIVEIEARTNRAAGGKDIARAQFSVSGVLPFLRSVPQEQLFAGEDMSLDIGVEGLDDPLLYSWKLFEDTGRGDTLLKTAGRGSLVTFRIPNSYTGKRLVVDARYNGRPYRFFSRASHASGDSRFTFPVIEPPTRIAAELPLDAPASASFRFTASKYNDDRFRGEQPVDRLGDVNVEILNEAGVALKTEVWMMRKGEFEFSLADRTALRKGGERVIVRIHADGSTLQRSIHLQ